MNDYKWRFPGNNHTAETGLDTPEMETFKKDPTASLARELCQNSIDARDDKEEPVRIEFKTFTLKKKDLPNIQRLEREIESCKDYWETHPKINKQLREMKKALAEEEIQCLRVSDFNTKGLIGVQGEKTPWYFLTKGTGISEKTGTQGGSKGIGKFATFVTSAFHTVFYSTRTIDNEKAYQGISKLCSTYVEESNSSEKTQGIGYYGADRKNRPLLEYYSLDPDFMRQEEEYGTDVFIIGFKNEKRWLPEVVTNILDSFMAAIVYGDLSVTVDNHLIDKDTVGDIVESKELILQKKKDKKNIISQYKLLTDETVYRTTLEIPMQTTVEEVDLFIKGFSRDESDLATNRSVIIRYPFMKIKDFKTSVPIPCAAMCIIGDNSLNELLRNYENPQHTDWHTKNISDSAERKEIRNIIKDLERKIDDEIKAFLSEGNTEETDIEGAEDYLPDTGGDTPEEKMQEFGGMLPRVGKTSESKHIHNRGTETDSDATGRTPDVGSVDDEGENADKPEGSNEGQGGSPSPSGKPGGAQTGDSEILKREHLRDIKYRFLIIDRENSEYRLVFTSPYQEENAELKLYYVDDVGRKNSVKILEASERNEDVSVNDEGNVELSLKKDRKYSITLKPDISEVFSAEVKLYANRA